MTLVSRCTLSFLLLLLGCCAGISHAQTVFSGADDPRGALANSAQAEANFKAALGDFGTETFDALPPFTFNPNLAFGATGITATTTDPTFSTLVFNFQPPFAISEANVLVNFPGLTFDFSQPVEAFGTYLINLGDFPADTPNALTFVLENTRTGASKTLQTGDFGPNAAFDNVAYFGFVDAGNPFHRVQILPSNPSDGFAFDNITVGSAAVPEPGSFALLAASALSLLALRRRNNAKKEFLS